MSETIVGRCTACSIRADGADRLVQLVLFDSTPRDNRAAFNAWLVTFKRAVSEIHGAAMDCMKCVERPTFLAIQFHRDTQVVRMVSEKTNALEDGGK